MHYHRGLIFWGLALITGGAVALAAQQGYLDHDVLTQAWRLWPVILIAIGLAILLSRTPFAVVGTIAAALVVGAAGGAIVAVGPGVASCGGPEPTDITSFVGTFGDQARVGLDFNCGTLKVGMVDGNGWSVASGGGDGAPTINAGNNHVDVSHPGDSWFGPGSRQVWNIKLPMAPTLELDVAPNAADTRIDLGGGHFTSVALHPNAGSIFIDLTDAHVDDLTLALNAGSASVVIGPGSDLNAIMNVNAGSIDVCTAEGVALQVTADPNLTFSTNLDESGLVQTGDDWSTPGYADAAAQVHIDLEGNAGNFTLNPEEGCS
jgi:hypothetical protein